MKKKIILIAAICIPILSGHISTSSANNLSIKSGSVSGSNVIFTVSWDNSWYNNSTDNPNNWDAVWVFVKYKNCDSTKWSHADLSKTSGDHVVASPLKADAVTDGKGVFLRRSAVGKGNISSVLCTLKLATITSGSYDFRIFGIEMVYAPQDTFQLGDGVSNNTFNSITVNSALQSTGITSAVLGGGASANIPSTYPMGYNGFYCMKYEITQGQFIDFLNSLSYEQQSGLVGAPNSLPHTAVLAGSSRNFIKISISGIATTTSKTPAVYGCDYNNNKTYNENGDGLQIACNFLSWAKVAAYLDWACLRPMSDLEFEKICRGPLKRSNWELPWGSNYSQPSSLTQATSWSISNAGMSNETYKGKGNGLAAYWCSNGLGACVNCGSGGISSNGPLRVGFAATSTSTRDSSGAAYYGAMEMGGNVWERVVAISTTGYKGTLGDGILTSNGNHTNSDWPAVSGSGSGFRGGGWMSTDRMLLVSDRSFATSSGLSPEDGGCTASTGGRGVR